MDGCISDESDVYYVVYVCVCIRVYGVVYVYAYAVLYLHLLRVVLEAIQVLLLQQSQQVVA
jgi:hypothetical protein